MRALVFALACAYAAASPYTLPQALASGSFLESSKDVLSIVAPTIDPQLKLAAQATVTLSTSSGAHSALIETMFRKTAVAKVIEARRVVSFTMELRVIPSDDVGAVTELMSGWAARTFGSSGSDVLVVKDPGTVNGNKAAYNVTIAAKPFENSFVSTPGRFLNLIGLDNPQCDTTLNAKDIDAGCGALCSAFSNRQGSPVTPFTTCTGSILRKSIGYRYVVDFFSSFSTPSGVTARRLQDTQNYLPSTILQYKLPTALPEPGEIDRLPILAATFGASVVIFAGVAYFQYKIKTD